VHDLLFLLVQVLFSIVHVILIWVAVDLGIRARVFVIRGGA
jgi:hypothetical protein